MNKYLILCAGLITWNTCAMLTSAVSSSLRPACALACLQHNSPTMPSIAHRFNSSSSKRERWERLQIVLLHCDEIHRYKAALSKALKMAADARKQRTFCSFGAIGTGSLSAATFFSDLPAQLPTIFQASIAGYSEAICATILTLMAIEGSSAISRYEKERLILSKRLDELRSGKADAINRLVDGEPTEETNKDEQYLGTLVGLDVQLSSSAPADQASSR